VASQPDGTGAAPAPGTLAAKVRDEAAAAAANDPAHTDAGGSLRTVDFPQVTDPSPSAPGPARPRGRRAGASPPARRGG
jgi:hypothetical protein